MQSSLQSAKVIHDFAVFLNILNTFFKPARLVFRILLTSNVQISFFLSNYQLRGFFTNNTLSSKSFYNASTWVVASFWSLYLVEAIRTRDSKNSFLDINLSPEAEIKIRSTALKLNSLLVICS